MCFNPTFVAAIALLSFVALHVVEAGPLREKPHTRKEILEKYDATDVHQTHLLGVAEFQTFTKKLWGEKATEKMFHDAAGEESRISRTKAIAYIVFKEHDADSSEHLEKDEFINACMALEIPREMAETDFPDVAGKDNKVSVFEFYAHLFFLKHDTNKNGHLEKNEFNLALKDLGENHVSVSETAFADAVATSKCSKEGKVDFHGFVAYIRSHPSASQFHPNGKH